ARSAQHGSHSGSIELAPGVARPRGEGVEVDRRPLARSLEDALALHPVEAAACERARRDIVVLKVGAGPSANELADAAPADGTIARRLGAEHAIHSAGLSG